MDVYKVILGVVNKIKGEDVFAQGLGRTGIDFSPEYFFLLIHIKSDLFYS